MCDLNGGIKMKKQKYWVVGLTHTDLAWKKGREEMAELLEVFIVRLLDILDTEPSFTYMIEQAIHYRDLLRHRPDLVQRLAAYVQSGRIEVVGGVASSQDLNVPNGESYIRNQLLGMKWVKECFGVEIHTGMLIDTFGFHPQMPQILRQFGISRILANRLGGNQLHDVFFAEGLDGSRVLFAGRDILAPYVKPGQVYFQYAENWSAIDQLFREAEQAQGDGPYLVTVYTENETVPSKRPLHWVRRLNGGQEAGEWRFDTLSSYMDALEAAGKEWPVVHGDLNPEFTGTFSLRNDLRLRNRRVEVLLLEAEKWAALTRVKGAKQLIDEAWWEMSYIQFHDVLTGSHPTAVYLDCLQRLEQVELEAGRLLRQALPSTEGERVAAGRTTATLVNGLPWTRSDIIRIPLPPGWQGVSAVAAGSRPIPFAVEGGMVELEAEVPAAGLQAVELAEGPPPAAAVRQDMAAAVLENDYIRLECDSRRIITRLIWKPTNRLLLKDVGDLIVLQQDQGNFQIEEPVGAEIPAAAGDYKIVSAASSPVGQSLVIEGRFPAAPWLPGKETPLAWELTFFLGANKPYLDLRLRLSWSGEQSRVRLKLTTPLEHTEGYYDTPFGVVRRRPYQQRQSARGEWPAHRFAGVENRECGLCLVNNGIIGAEISGGNIWTTLLRAPAKEYAGMMVDDTSSEHGEHLRQFRLLPYEGSWQHSGALQAAQEFNNPVLGLYGMVQTLEATESRSFLAVRAGSVVLSTVKLAEDGSDELIVRLYEAAGEEGTARLYIRDAVEAWESNLKEDRLAPLCCGNEELEVKVKPYEIKTVRVLRTQDRH